MSPLLRSSLWLLPALLAAGCASNSVVNLSHYDEMRVDFGQMADAQLVGVIHEATYPVGVADRAYGSRQQSALAAGLLWGAYHFADATDPVRQADRFLAVVESRWRQCAHASGVLLVLDFEVNNHYPGGTMRPEQAVAFIERIHERTGRYPGFYASENRLKRLSNDPALDPSAKATLARCWLWIANYHYKPTSPEPWRRWDLWQYTGDGTCDLPRGSYPTGIANIRNAERNIFRGSRSAARAFWNEHAWKPGPEILCGGTGR